MNGRVLFYVQHLLGVGHVFRAMRIVRALGEHGIEVDLIYGGEPVPNIDAGSASIHYLPPLRAGSKVFSELERPDGTVADEAYRHDRRRRILSILEKRKPDAVITEAFPFGRRQMRFELLPLLTRARELKNRPLIVASVRDILQERSKPGRIEETIVHIDRFYDRVLVHGDPRMVRLEETFPLADRFAVKTHYTGIVAPDHDKLDDNAEAFDVVVSVGGGMLGPQLLEAAAQAKAMSSMADARWMIATGPRSAGGFIENIKRIAGSNTVVMPFIKDLASTLAKTKLSISRCGYNTVADIFTAGCRAIVIPLSDGVETEQLKRAEILKRRGLAEVISPNLQTGEALAAAIDRVLERPLPDRSGIDVNGAAISADFIAGWLRARRRE